MGNYSIGRLIGKGSFGKVYLATHKLTNGSKVYSLISFSSTPLCGGPAPTVLYKTGRKHRGGEH